MGSSLVVWRRIGILFLAPAVLVWAGEEEKVYSKIPIREVTIFKDGHAFVLHEGLTTTDADGNVVMDELPQPIMGTFWAYSADPAATLSCVVSGRETVEKQKESTALWELIKGNVGRRMIVRETTGRTYEATILRLMESRTPPADPPQNCQPSMPANLPVLLKVTGGVKAMPVQQIQDVTFLDQPSMTAAVKENRDSMTLKLDWPQGTAASARVGMSYVQLGLRWIPSYHVEIDGKGKAVIKLKGTLINELADLKDVKAHLVIGVPKFAFAQTPDPVSLQETVAQLSRHFRPDSQTAYSFYNSIMTRQARFTEAPRYDYQPGSPAEIDLGPEMEGTEKNEDLFVFSLDHITLKKGQRMVLPITEVTLAYEDVFALDLPFAPPLEMRRNFNSDQHLQLARLFHAPRAIHKLRLDNRSETPLTTAPATIFKDGRILAQGMMAYTTIGGKGDLEVTTALEITVDHSDRQTNVTPNAVQWNGSSFSRVDMEGTIRLKHYGGKPAKVIVKRSVMGTLDAAGREGQIRQLGHGYDAYAFEGGAPFWWNWCSWPWWWYRFNSIGQASWTADLEPGESVELTYTWHYFWN